MNLLFIILILPLLLGFNADENIETGKVYKDDECNYIICAPEKLKVFISSKGMSVNSFVKNSKYKGKVVAAINASFFDKAEDTYIPTGLVIDEGKILWKSTIDVAAGKCKKRNSSYVKNKARVETNWFYVIYTTKDSLGGAYSSGIMHIRDFQKEYLGTHKKKEIVMAIETGPLVLQNSEITHEAFKDRPSREKKVQRSAVGITKDGNFLIYQSRKGMTFVELATSMKNHGAIIAVGLDGGSSCSFATPKTRTKEVKVNTILYVAP